LEIPRGDRQIEYWQGRAAERAAEIRPLHNSKSIKDCRPLANSGQQSLFSHGVAENIEITWENAASVISKAPMKFCHFRHSAGFRLIRASRMGLDDVLPGHRRRPASDFLE
jgi:hypothetical protein